MLTTTVTFMQDLLLALKNMKMQSLVSRGVFERKRLHCFLLKTIRPSAAVLYSTRVFASPLLRRTAAKPSLGMFKLVATLSGILCIDKKNRKTKRPSPPLGLGPLGHQASPPCPCFPAPLFTGGRGRADACHGTGHRRGGHPAALPGDHLAYKTGALFPRRLEP